MRGQRSISRGRNFVFKFSKNYPDLKKGIKLPKSPIQWSNANDFFQFNLSNQPITTQEISKCINTMTTVIYNYFSENYGFVEINNNKVFS